MRIISFFVILLIANTAALSGAESYRLKYTVTWGIFAIYETTVDVTLSSDRYAISAKGKTKGVAALFNGGRSHVSAEGLRTKEGPIPLLYQNRGKFEGKAYHRALFFNEHGALTTSAADWPEDWQKKYKREPVPDALKKGPDPISLITRLVEENSLFNRLVTTSEPLVLRAFDGRVVGDYEIACKNTPERLKKSSKSLFSGEAYACYTDFELVAGKIIETEELKKERAKRRKKAAKQKKKAKDTNEDQPDDERLKVWLARIEGLPSVIPVRSAVKSGFGTVRVYLREIEKGGEYLPLTTDRLDKDFCKKAATAIPSAYCSS